MNGIGIEDDHLTDADLLAASRLDHVRRPPKQPVVFDARPKADDRRNRVMVDPGSEPRGKMAEMMSRSADR